MRIGLNALFLRWPATGTGQHLHHLLQGLDEQDHQNTYVLLSPRFPGSSPAGLPQLSDRFQYVEVPSALGPFGEALQKLWWEQVSVVRTSQREKIELLHCPYFAPPYFLPARTVVTIHDVIPWILPEYAARPQSRMYNRLIALTARRVDAVITVSECSRRDIVRFLSIPPERIHVIGNAVDASYRPVTDPQLMDTVRQRYGIGPGYLLYFGGFDLRKNLDRILRAYAALPASTRDEHQLVIAGRLHLVGHPLYPDPRPRIWQLGLEDSVVVTGPVEERDKPALYSGATIFLFPSLYEGFGIPVLEAMACGAAVITSDRSACPEVAGDAARLVDPYDVAQMAAAITELLENSALRNELRERALARARQFSWGRVAQQTIQVYNQLGSLPPRHKEAVQ